MERIKIIVIVISIFMFVDHTPVNGSLFDNDSLRYKIGQMMIFGFRGDNVPRAISDEIIDYNIGGVLLYRVYDNITADHNKTRQLIHDLQAASHIPLLIATDQEPGLGNLRSSTGFEDTMHAYDLGRLTEESITRSIASKFATWFTDLGINANFAPVVDLRLNPDNVIGDRSFGSDPDTVVQNAAWFIDEFRERNLITTIKHFPGHGSSIGDSHLGFTDVSDTWTDIELVPFRSLINSGLVDMVMTAHIFNTKFDNQHPATLSHSTITGLLRDSLNFKGVVITDAMFMRAIRDNYTVEESITLAINAGVDIVLYNWDDDFEGHRLAPLFVDHVEAMVLENTISRARIEESYGRITALKRNLNVSVVDDEGLSEIPPNFVLSNYPNPFNEYTRFQYTLYERSRVSGMIYNLLGVRVKILLNAYQSPGAYTLTWDGNDDRDTVLPSGFYVFILRINALNHEYIERVKVQYLK